MKLGYISLDVFQLNYTKGLQFQQMQNTGFVRTGVATISLPLSTTSLFGISSIPTWHRGYVEPGMGVIHTKSQNRMKGDFDHG
jgi:hypothetical protein